MQQVVATSFSKPREGVLVVGELVEIEFAHQVAFAQTLGCVSLAALAVFGQEAQLLRGGVEGHLDGLRTPDVAQVVAMAAEDELANA